MDEISQVRSNNWIQLIHARQESGLTIKDWCAQNNVSLHAYYYWLRKLRKQALQEAGITSKSIDPPSQVCTATGDINAPEAKNRFRDKEKGHQPPKLMSEHNCYVR